MGRNFLLRAAAAALVSLAVISPARAQLYVAGSAGIEQPFDNSGTINGTPTSLTANTGYALAGAVGYRLPRQFRVELEAAIERGGLDQVGAGGVSFKANGNLDIRTITANVYYDIPLDVNWVPYVGGGLGYAQVYGLSAGAGAVTVGNPGTSGNFVWQLEAGLGYRVNDRLVIAPAYRFQQVQNAGLGLGNTQISIFKLGLRYGF